MKTKHKNIILFVSKIFFAIILNFPSLFLLCRFFPFGRYIVLFCCVLYLLINVFSFLSKSFEKSMFVLKIIDILLLIISILSLAGLLIYSTQPVTISEARSRGGYMFFSFVLICFSIFYFIIAVIFNKISDNKTRKIKNSNKIKPDVA